MTEYTQPITCYRPRTKDFVNIGGEKFVQAISGGFIWSKRYGNQVPRPVMVAYAVEDAMYALENNKPIDVRECIRAAQEIGYMIGLLSKFSDGMGFGTDAGLGGISLSFQLALTTSHEEALNSLRMARRTALLFVELNESEMKAREFNRKAQAAE